jgi:uncharacterized RDD family membrane protein YckC
LEVFLSDIPTDISLPPADIPVRAAARAIEVLLLGAIDGLLGKWMGLGFDWLLISAAVVITYFALMDTYWGGTPGKFALGLVLAKIGYFELHSRPSR